MDAKQRKSLDTYQSPKTESIIALCKSLKEKGLIDGIGMQGYWGIDYPSIYLIEPAIKKFAELDLEIQITELSVAVENETIVGYCTFSERDELSDEYDYSPFIGFVFVLRFSFCAVSFGFVLVGGHLKNAPYIKTS